MATLLTLYLFPKASGALGGGHPTYFDQMNLTGKDTPQNDPLFFSQQVNQLAEDLDMVKPLFHLFDFPWAADIRISTPMAILLLYKKQKGLIPELEKYFSVRRPKGP